MVPVDGDHRELVEKVPQTGALDIDSARWKLLFGYGGEDGGATAAVGPGAVRGGKVEVRAAYEGLVKEMNVRYHFFGNDPEINTHGVPAGRKLVITDELLNEWLASQWTNFSLENVPLNRPTKMDASLHKRFLNQYQQNKERARK